MSFWASQPINIKSTNKLKLTDIKIPDGFIIKETSIINIPSIINLLNNEYIKDEDCRLIYSNNLLNNELKLGKRICLYKIDEDCLIGFIHLKYIDLLIKGEIYKFASINFLCLSNKYRNKNLAPLLISYARGLANLENVFSAIFTGGVELPCKLIKAQYLHKILPNKQVLFPRRGTRIFKEGDTENVMNLLNKRTIKLYEYFSNKETFYEKYKTIEDSVYSFVYEEDNKIIEFGSFFIIFNQIDNKMEKNAYLYLYFSESKNILKDLFAFSNKIDCSFFNMLDINKNREFFDEYQLFNGSGVLNYFLFNFNKQIDIQNNDIDFVMF